MLHTLYTWRQLPTVWLKLIRNVYFGHIQGPYPNLTYTNSLTGVAIGISCLAKRWNYIDPERHILERHNPRSNIQTGEPHDVLFTWKIFQTIYPQTSWFFREIFSFTVTSEWLDQLILKHRCVCSWTLIHRLSLQWKAINTWCLLVLAVRNKRLYHRYYLSIICIN